MKRAKSLFNQIVSFENLRLAWLKARKGKTSKTAIKNFSHNVNTNLQLLHDRMISSPPLLSNYVQFKICDPKERIISVVPFSDRVIHHAIINVLEPVFERQFIFHTYACRKGKGTHAAARYAFKCAKRTTYFLKLDVRKYFDSIDHSVLKNLLCRIIKDTRCLELLFSVIDSYETNKSCGLPIGNLTSQFFANLYLSSLDHFVLEQLMPKGYVRYMDDMVIFADSVAELKGTFLQVERFCREKLHLFLKEPVFGKTRNGVSFLGWRITSTGIFLPGKTKRRMKKKLHEIQKDYNDGKISEEKMYERAMAVFASRKL
ncbi:MAG: group II intron reverse transcriptase domain-containing protein [Treponema sp.]|nr:group II intron reverse transcriptase domain-containing protein [Treponema sp.]